MLFRPLPALLVLAALTPAWAAVSAQADDFTPVTATVSFADLNLSQAADAKVLAGRLAEAAKSVCLKANPDLAMPALMQQCTMSAIGTGMAGLEDVLDQNAHAKLAVVRTSLASP